MIKTDRLSSERAAGLFWKRQIVENLLNGERLSAVAELMKTAIVREIFGELTARLAARKPEGANQETDAAMGSGSVKARQTMMMEMPLEAFVTYGVIGEKELDGLMERLNL